MDNDVNNLANSQQRYVVGLEYNGSQYHGFQKQKHSISIQEMVEKALSYVGNQPIEILCAGRTDAGVHAIGQVIHFDAPKGLRSESNWLLGANTHLPRNIQVHYVKAITNNFHARFSAYSREYIYCLRTQSGDRGIMSSYYGYTKHALSIEIMKEASSLWLGEHDFSSFRSLHCQSSTPMRNLHGISIVKKNDAIYFQITANAFLHRMVRIIVGALIEIGRGKQSIDWARDLILPDTQAQVTSVADAKGLYLSDVAYPEYFKVPRINRNSLMREVFDHGS